MAETTTEQPAANDGAPLEKGRDPELARERAEMANAKAKLRDRLNKQLGNTLYESDGDRPYDTPKGDVGTLAKPKKEVTPESAARAAERKEKERLAKAKHANERDRRAKDHILTQHERHIEDRARALEEHEARSRAEVEAFKREPLAYLKKRGVNTRELLIGWANEDAEAPSRELRELQKKTEATERKLAAREAREAEQALSRDQAEASEQLRQELAGEWRGAKDAYPLLAETYDAAEVAELARETTLLHYQWTGQALDPSDVFERLENAIASQRQAREKREHAKAPKPTERGAETKTQLRARLARQIRGAFL